MGVDKEGNGVTGSHLIFLNILLLHLAKHLKNQLARCQGNRLHLVQIAVSTSAVFDNNIQRVSQD